MLIDNINSYISLLIEKIYSISKEIGIEYEYAKCLCQTDDISELETSIGILQGTVRSNDEKEVLLSYIVNKYNIRLDSLITPFFFNVLTPQPEGNFGDMFKSIYDPNNDGRISVADSVYGILSAGNNTYYGKNNSGETGFFSVPTPNLTDYYTKSETDLGFISPSELNAATYTQAVIDGKVAFSNSDFITNTTVGFLTSGTNIKNKTLIQIFQSMLQGVIAATSNLKINSYIYNNGSTFINVDLSSLNTTNVYLEWGNNYINNSPSGGNLIVINPSITPNSITLSNITNTAVSTVVRDAAIPDSAYSTSGSSTGNTNFALTLNQNLRLGKLTFSFTQSWSIPSSGTLTKSISISILPPIYYGFSTNDYSVTGTKSALDASNSGLSKFTGAESLNKNKTNISITTTGAGNFYYLFPASLGLITSIKDENNIEVLDNSTGFVQYLNISITQTTNATSNNVLYNIYKANITSTTIVIKTFTFYGS